MRHVFLVFFNGRVRKNATWRAEQSAEVLHSGGPSSQQSATSSFHLFHGNESICKRAIEQVSGTNRLEAVIIIRRLRFPSLRAVSSRGGQIRVPFPRPGPPPRHAFANARLSSAGLEMTMASSPGPARPGWPRTASGRNIHISPSTTFDWIFGARYTSARISPSVSHPSCGLARTHCASSRTGQLCQTRRPI